MALPNALPCRKLSFAEVYGSLPALQKRRLQKTANALAFRGLIQQGIGGDDLLQEAFARCSAIDDWSIHQSPIAVIVRKIVLAWLDSLRKVRRWPASHRGSIETDSLVDQCSDSPEEAVVRSLEIEKYLSGLRPDTLKLVHGLILGMRGHELFVWTGFDENRFKNAYRDLQRKYAKGKKSGD